MVSTDMDQGLVIVPAGAGAGKTHRIKTQLSDWVKRGIVRPERILAVTFTEAAAGELRERIRAGLLADGLVAEAMAVERAYVSTIHGLGLRLLTEHALAAGTSPQPRHLADAERDGDVVIGERFNVIADRIEHRPELRVDLVPEKVKIQPGSALPARLGSARDNWTEQLTNTAGQACLLAALLPA